MEYTNPYIHYSLEDPAASKTCRGQLFYGVDEMGVQVAGREDILRRRRQRNNDWENEDWNNDYDDE